MKSPRIGLIALIVGMLLLGGGTAAASGSRYGLGANGPIISTNEPHCSLCPEL